MKEKVKNDSNINIKQILIIIFFILVIIIGIYANNYNENNNTNEQPVISYTLDTIPEYSSEPCITINNSIPNFQENDFTTNSFEDYSDLDDYGRCGVAFANLYNKCHLIAYSLSAENANDKNIITGTRYFNISGMTPFENRVRKYLNDNPNNHCLYRVTPIYEEENKVASGITIEAESVEDKGASICFYVYIYNVQPSVIIDYATGNSKLSN